MENYLVELNMISLGDEACCLKKSGMNTSLERKENWWSFHPWRREATKPPHWTLGALRRSNSDEYGKMRQKDTANVCVTNSVPNILSKQHLQKMKGVAFEKGLAHNENKHWMDQGIGSWLFLGSHNFCEAQSRSVTMDLQSNIASVFRG